MGKHKTSMVRAAAAAAAAGLLVAACGGGGGGGSAAVSDPNVPGTDVPQSATTSAQGAFAFARLAASADSETAEPLVVGDVTLATSETDEPDPGV